MKGFCGECDRRWACDIDPDKCDEWPDPVPMTNADRIRAMSDEELAKFLCTIRSSQSYGFPCSYCVAEEFCHDGHTGMIDWLQQPAEE